jgi:hypothetical protein
MDLPHFLGSVINATDATAIEYAGNFSLGTPVHAAPFFGRVDVASYATVGLNPSPAEFQQGRWPQSALPLNAHLSRLSDYFVSPSRPYYESWFGVWERALAPIGKSYFQDTVHLDLSPRATVPVRSCPDRPLFVKMVAADIRWFFALLAGLPHIRGLLVAGSSLCMTRNGNTGSVYLDRIIRQAGPRFSFELSRAKCLRQSGPKIALYHLSRPKRDSIPVFFCGMSPSGNSPGDLIYAVQQYAALLKRVGF